MFHPSLDTAILSLFKRLFISESLIRIINTGIISIVANKQTLKIRKGCKIINDQFTKGVIAGISGAILQNFYAYFAKLLGFTNTNYLDVAHAVLLNTNNEGFFAILVSLLGHLVIDGFWGVIFVHLIVNISEENFYFKGIAFGFGIWFFVRVIITKLFKLSVLFDNTPEVALFFFIGSALYGLTLVFVLKVLNKHKIIS